LTETEEALAERSRRGDREAFEELVRCTAGGLFARLYLETADPHRAEDLAQETFLAAWRSVRSLEDARRFRPWLYAIAHSVLLDSVRKESRLKRSGGKIFGGKISGGNFSSGNSFGGNSSGGTSSAGKTFSGNSSGKNSAGDNSDEILDCLTDQGPGPAQNADLRDQREKALAALRSMPSEYRLPLTMRYLAGADYRTIGKELAITNGSLRGLLSRGMAMLREKLKEKRQET
jgi:RNA polymerase sigma factor (sigma-70 family)